jgi:hypothetical protein
MVSPAGMKTGSTGAAMRGEAAMMAIHAKVETAVDFISVVEWRSEMVLR